MTPFRPAPPLVIGLVGGIASGKSAVAALFAAQGLCRIDADREARRVVDRPEVRAGLRARFGDSIFAADGSLDRAALGALVFADAEARRDLEALTHPAIRAAIAAALDAALAAGDSVLLDVPLLLEGGLVDRCDAVVFVDAPESLRAARVRARGWAEGELQRREAAQLPLAVKKARATASIENAGDLDRTRSQVVRLLAEWRNVRPQHRA
jgi:dephospho-CoA kinase